MKTSAALLSLFFFLDAVSAAPKKPNLSLTLKDGTFSGINPAIAPKVSWKGSCCDGEVDIGADIDIVEGCDLMSATKSIWAETNTDIKGWKLKSRAEISEGKYDYDVTEKRGVYVALELENESEDSFAWFSGAGCAAGAKPLKIGAKKVFTINDDVPKLMVAPQYNFETEKPEIVLGGEKGATRAYLSASKEDQDLKIIHKINDDNTASLKVGRGSGFISAELENKSDLGSSTITVKPDDIDFKLSKDGWTGKATLSKPYLESDPKISFSKKFTI